MTSEDKELITLDATKTTLLSSSPEFEAWVASLDPKHWAKYDLGACRLGWEAGRASLTDALATIVLLQSQYREQQDHDTAERLAAEAREKRLREALKPFAVEANEWADMWHDDYVPVLTPSTADEGDNERAAFTVGDLRRARAALGEQG